MALQVNEVTVMRSPQAQLNGDYENESFQLEYWIYINEKSLDIPTIFKLAQAPGFTNSLPARMQKYPFSSNYDLYATSFVLKALDNHLTTYSCTVTFTALPPFGLSRTDNPLDWPPEIRIASWIEEEYVITHGWNREALGHGNSRPANTYGPIVNGALQEFDEPLMGTRRWPVISIRRNVPGSTGLLHVVAIHEQYKESTNSVPFLGAPSLSCEYKGVLCSDLQRLNGVDYFTLDISILIRDTTAKTINNVGWNNLDFDGFLTVCKVRDPDTNELVRPSEPVFLTALGGRAAKGETPTITYDYLRFVDYNPLAQHTPRR